MIYVKRETWSSDRNPASLGTTILSKTGGVIVHHTVSGGAATRKHEDCEARLRRHRDYHMDSRRWAFLAYSWFVCPHGTIYEGRGWGHNGANAPVNKETVSVCWEGTIGDPVRAGAITALNEVIDEARKRGFSDLVRGHGDVRVGGTSCPGELRALIADGTLGGAGPVDKNAEAIKLIRKALDLLEG